MGKGATTQDQAVVPKLIYSEPLLTLVGTRDDISQRSYILLLPRPLRLPWQQLGPHSEAASTSEGHVHLIVPVHPHSPASH